MDIFIDTILGLPKYYTLEKSLQQVKREEYYQGHKCQQFSKELVELLEKQGIQSEVVYGESLKTSRQKDIIHAWVGIWIEPQTGEFTKGYIK